MTNDFIWADLSTFDIQAARQFYSDCFGWQYDDIGDGYLSCRVGDVAAAGLYTMPEKFQKIGMPSFWMSYIRIADIDAIVALAEEYGGKVEVQPQPAPGGGTVALIRDPAGAGFTVYQGEDPNGRDAGGQTGRLVWNELHVSSLALVEDFYLSVFGWKIHAADDDNRYLIYTDADKLIAGIQESPNEMKGDKEYWGCYFAVDDLAAAGERVRLAGGEIVVEQLLGAQKTALVFDQQRAAFYLLERETAGGAQQVKSASPVKWRAMLGLGLVACAVLFELNRVWGMLFLLWVVPDIKSGSTHFIEHVQRSRNPVVFWLIIGTWLTLSAYLLLAGL